MRARCQLSPQVSFKHLHSPLWPSMHPQCPGKFKIPWKTGEWNKESVKRENKWKKVGAQIGQLGCAGSWVGLLQMPEKEFKDHKGDSVKAITCPKLPGQQA